MSRLFCGTLVAIFLSVYVLNAYYPIMSDDYSFLYVWRGEYGGALNAMQPDYPFKRIEGLTDIFASLHSLYFTWGGRIVTWFWVYVSMLVGKEWFNFINASLFVVLLVLTAMIGTQKFSLRELKPFWIVAAFLTVWGCNSEFTNAYLWVSGSVGYLWTGVVQLSFLYFYARFYWRGEEPNFRAPTFFMSVLGFFAGQTTENAGTVTLFLTFFYSLFLWRKKNLRRWMAAGVVGCVAGWLILVAAPGNYVRYAIDVITFNEWNFYNHFIVIVPFFAMCFPMLLTILFVPKIKSDKLRRFAICFFAAGFINALMMFVPPNCPPRSLSGTVLFWTAAAFSVLQDNAEIFKLKFYRAVYGFFAAASVVTLALFMYTMIVYLFPQDMMRDESARMSAGEDFVVPPYRLPEGLLRLAGTKGYRRHVGLIEENVDAWINREYAEYYGLKTVVRKEFFEAGAD